MSYDHKLRYIPTPHKDLNMTDQGITDYAGTETFAKEPEQAKLLRGEW